MLVGQIDNTVGMTGMGKEEWVRLSVYALDYETTERVLALARSRHAALAPSE